MDPILAALLEEHVVQAMQTAGTRVRRIPPPPPLPRDRAPRATPMPGELEMEIELRFFESDFDDEDDTVVMLVPPDHG